MHKHQRSRRVESACQRYRTTPLLAVGSGQWLSQLPSIASRGMRQSTCFTKATAWVRSQPTSQTIQSANSTTGSNRLRLHKPNSTSASGKFLEVANRQRHMSWDWCTCSIISHRPPRHAQNGSQSFGTVAYLGHRRFKLRSVHCSIRQPGDRTCSERQATGPHQSVAIFGHFNSGKKAVVRTQCHM